MKNEDVIIIGAGPAGLACALQLNRYGIKPLLFEKNEIGGLIRNANLVENYMGFPGGISGPELVQLFKEQISEFSFRIFYEEVIQIDFNSDLFQIETNKDSYSSRILVLASGTLPIKPVGPEIPSDVKGKVLYDILPIINCKNKSIVIIGAGDLAFDYALNLGKMNEIIMMNRSDKVKCIPVLHERVKKLNNFLYFGNTEIFSIEKDDEKLLIEYKNSHISNKICADYIIFAIGRIPNRKLVSDKLKESLRQSDKNNFFEIGDASNGIYRQASIAAGDGIKTAMKIYEIIYEK